MASKYSAKHEHIIIRIGNLDITLTETQVREAMRTAILKKHCSTLLRHSVDKSDIEKALDLFMKELVVPTLEEIR